MVRRKAVLIALAALAGAAPAAVPAAVPIVPRFNPKAPENTQLLPSFGFATVEPVLAGIGATFQRGGTPASPALLVTFANGRKAIVAFGSCLPDGSGCKALSIQSFWTKVAGASSSRTAAEIEGFNRRYSFGKSFVAADGRPTLQRYLTADYGFVRGNLAVNFLVFSEQCDRFALEVLKPLAAPRR